MNTRIKELRKSLGLTQSEFAQKIGLGFSALSKIEVGTNTPTPQTIQLICQQFGVERDWLVEGTGSMRVPPDRDDEIIDAVLAGEDEFVKAVIRGIAKSPGGWEKMREVFTAIAEELQKNTPKP